MPIKIIVVENKELFNLISQNNKQDVIEYYSKEKYGVKEPLSIRDAAKLSEYDIILMEGMPADAEYLRTRILTFTRNNIVIARYNHNDYFDHFGHYQIALLNESFRHVKDHHAKNPGIVAYEKAIEKLEELKLENKGL